MTWLLPEEGEQVADTLYPSEEPEGQKEPAFEEDYETADSKVHENLSGHSHFVMAGYRKWNRPRIRADGQGGGQGDRNGLRLRRRLDTMHSRVGYEHS